MSTGRDIGKQSPNLPREDSVNLDIVRAELVGKRVCQLADGGLHGAVDGEGGHGLVGGEGADVDDFAPFAALNHVPGDALGQNPNGVEVDLDDLIQ